MKIKATIKRYVAYFFYVLAGIGIISFLSFSVRNYYNRESGTFSIKIDYSHKHRFVDEQMVEEILFLPRYQKSRVGHFPLHLLEQKLEAYPHIKNAEVYFGVDGHLWVEVEQVNPICRIFNQKRESFYMDEEGRLLPLSQQYVARVPIVNGNVIIGSHSMINKSISDFLSDSSQPYLQWKEIYDLSLYLHRHPFWQKQIQQIHVNKDFEYELLTRIGNHRIVMGKPYPMQEKFTRLMILYRKAFPVVGWNRYKEINLKYDNQIICQ